MSFFTLANLEVLTDYSCFVSITRMLEEEEEDEEDDGQFSEQWSQKGKSLFREQQTVNNSQPVDCCNSFSSLQLPLSSHHLT